MYHAIFTCAGRASRSSITTTNKRNAEPDHAMKLWGTEISGLNLPFFGRQRQARRVGNIGKTRACPGICALGVLVGFIILSTSLACDASVRAFAAEPSSQVGVGEMEKDRGPGRKTLIADAEEEARVRAKVVERFTRGLDELDQKMPRRPVSILELDVTELFRPFLPDNAKVKDAVRTFNDLGLSLRQDKNGDHTYTYVYVEHDRLAAQGRTHFLPGDRLVINYTAGSASADAEIIRFRVTLLNQGRL